MLNAILLSAFLLYLSLPNFINPLGMDALAWLFAMPLCSALEDEPFKKRILTGALFGFIFFTGFIHWFAAYNFLGYGALTLAMAIQPMIFAMLYPCQFKNFSLKLLYVPSAWVAAEFIHSKILNGFLWSIGYSQSFNPLILQIAKPLGPHGLSFFIILAGYALYKMTKDFKAKYIYMFIVLAVPIFLNTFGYLTLTFSRPPHVPQRILSACIVQPNTDQRQKLGPAAIDSIMKENIALTQNCFSNFSPEMIIWPETAIPDNILIEENLKNEIMALVEQTKTNFLIGSALITDEKTFNSAVLIDRQGRALNVYHKRHLVPFSEDLFSAGEKIGLMHLNKKPFGVAICSEDHYPALFKHMRKAKADFAVLLLNDGWFKHPQALITHLQASVFRAVENDMTLIRAANSGLSAIITPDGEIAHRLPLNKQGVLRVNILYTASSNIYLKFSDIFPVLCLGFVIINFILPFSKKGFALKKSLILVLLTISVLLSASSAYAGGAAAAAKRKKAPPHIQQQQIIQQRALQERRRKQQIQGNLDIHIKEQQFNTELEIPAAERVPEPEVVEVVEISQIWESMQTTSQSWDLMIDDAPKEATVIHFIDNFRQKGIKIQKPPSLYVQIIDSMTQEGPDLLKQPFENVLTMIAIMEYDFDNGQDKDSLAKKMLGEQGFIANKKRLGLIPNHQ